MKTQYIMAGQTISYAGNMNVRGPKDRKDVP